MPRGGWLREVRRWACCGLRRTGGPSPGFLGRFHHRRTVDFRAIEIDLQEAVSRFLNVPGKSGLSQSISKCVRTGNSAIRCQYTQY